MEQITIGEIISKSRSDLKGKWGTAIPAFIVYGLVVFVVGIIPILGSIAGLLMAAPLAIGVAIFSLNVVDNKSISLNQIFEGFKYDFGRSFVAYLLMILYILLWFLCLIIPGIIAAIGYSQVFFILSEDKNISAGDALKKSKAIMDGHKMEYFLLMLAISFLSVIWLVITLGIGIFWLFPFINACNANFYRKLVPAEEGPADYGEGKEHLLPQL